MILRLATRSLALDAPLVMGILNVTPDSFSDGGRWNGPERALRQAERMLAEGAAILDVGGESTRPGAQPVPEVEELDRVVPVIERLKAELDCVVSVDTMKPAVMRAALAAGAEIVNDVNALRAPGAIEALVEANAAACLMHMRGAPHDMQAGPDYGDVLTEVSAFLAERRDACMKAGIAADRLLLDPGIGFGKTLANNLTLLGRLDALHPLGCGIVLGASRKSLFGGLLGLPVGERLVPSLTVAALAVAQGVQVVRAHDVRETVQAVRTAAAVAAARGPRMLA